jgi:hypothetical protein
MPVDKMSFQNMPVQKITGDWVSVNKISADKLLQAKGLNKMTVN